MEDAVGQDENFKTVRTDNISDTPESRHAVRNNWSYDEIEKLFGLPFNDLLFEK